MKFHKTPLEGAYLIELEKRGDDRGFFARFFCEKEFGAAGLETRFVQINNSLTATKGTLRGMHYQLPPAAEVKVVRAVKGALWDVIVDLRAGSPTYGKWFGAELNDDNRLMMYVPRGFAHGFVTLTDNVEALLSRQRLLCARRPSAACAGTTRRSASNGRSSRGRFRTRTAIGPISTPNSTASRRCGA